MAQRIYLIEDDTALRTELAHVLELSGYAVAAYEGTWGDTAARALAAEPDCIVLDLKLPGADGHSICRDIRAKSSVPILMLTSSESEFDEVMAMNLGADDYVTKPYRPAVLLAHLQALLRRSASPAAGMTILHKGVTLNMGAGTVEFRGRTAELTRNELRILQTLMRNPGVVVPRSEIMCALWESDAFIDDNTLTVNVNRLRKTLGALGVPEDFLTTRRGVGHGTGEADTPIAPFTPATYVRDNVIGLAAFLLALASTVLILPALGVNSAGTLLVADVLTLIALGAGFLDYRRKAAFYHELHHLTGQLRQACVLPSLIAEPPFLDGKIAYDTASRLAQLSAEETAALRDNEAAYRRYVELWIHEIKTPIAAIKLMLANNPGPESAKVARELERIEAQVDQALYYARSTSVERDYAIREVNLADAAREACKRHSRFLIEKGCTPAFDIPDAMTVLADEPWLVFILGQVIVNAAKYGATTLTFTAREEEPGTSRGRTVLEVRDNGCGIPAADVPRVFERGFTGQVGRAHGSATGMGLYLVASLCASMGLHVGLASEEGTGTRVILTFPHDRTRKELFGA